MIIGVDTLPVLPTDPGDRNLTSSFLVQPAAVRYQTEIATNATALTSAGFDPDTTLLTMVTEPMSALTNALAVLKAALGEHVEGSAQEALFARDTLLPAMAAVRTASDTLESIVADDLWPLPTYQEMLYIL